LDPVQPVMKCQAAQANRPRPNPGGILPVWFALLCLLWRLASAASAGERLNLNFDADWRFIKADPAGAAAPGFDDSHWSLVSAPHTFNDIDTFDDYTVPYHVGETNQWAGRTWYRKSFTVPEAFRSKRIYIEFEAVRQIAEVYLNGQALGTNRTGFIPFGFDLTPYLRFGGVTNVLAVMADNRFTHETELARIAATELPWNSPHWHPAHGGIYRNVYLHVTDPLHISLPLYSALKTTGPYIYSTDISSNSAQVWCEVPVQNGRVAPATVTAHAEILDPAGKAVLVLHATNLVAAGGQQLFRFSGTVTHPQLWEPDYPYLYRARLMVSVGDRPVDDCEIPFGIRTVRFDVKTGFYVNGHHLKLHGWGQRPTDEWPGLGAAQPDWLHYYTLSLMKAAGGNFVRWGHCAGPPVDITGADRLGMFVLQPGVDGEGDAHGSAWTLRAAAFRDMLIYYRNHPSIIIWEGGNQKVIREHARQLRGLMDEYDPHGGRAYAHRRADAVTAEFMDVDLGTEGGRQAPRLPVVEAEYNREESPRRVWDDYSPPNFGYPEAKGQTYQLTSEQFAVDEVEQYVSKLGALNHCGGAKWIFSDTTSGGRVACEVARVSGEVDGVRLPKEGYYVCRAMFRDDPQVHIIGHWTYPAGTRKAVYVASNCEQVELLLNGKSLGRKASTNRFLFTFPDVTWEPGELKAVAYRNAKAAATDTRRTAGKAVGLRMSSIVGPTGFLANGADVALIDVEAIDAKGERCPTFQRRVDFDISGPGIWRGGYNSGKAHSINNPFLDLECGINRVSVRATRVPGTITVRARCPGLEPASIQLRSHSVGEGPEGGLAEAAQSGPKGARTVLPSGSSLVLPALPNPPALVRPVWRELAVISPVQRNDEFGRFLKAFSYSGPAAAVVMRQNARDGSRIYADRDFVFNGLPGALQGCDWVQTANADRVYSAVDLLDLTAEKESIIYVAHDDRLPRPEWLEQQFQPTSNRLAVNGRSMTIFQRRLRPGESVTLGSNTQNRKLKSGNMYIVFVKGQAQPPFQRAG
jgi:beta-galactosidase